MKRSEAIRLRSPARTVRAAPECLVELDRGRDAASGKRFIKQVLQFALLGHRFENIRVAVKLTVDEDLGQRLPIGHLRERRALGHVLEHVDDRERITEAIEKLNRLEGEAAARRVLGSFSLKVYRIGGDFFFDLLADGV